MSTILYIHTERMHPLVQAYKQDVQLPNSKQEKEKEKQGYAKRATNFYLQRQGHPSSQVTEVSTQTGHRLSLPSIKGKAKEKEDSAK